MAMSCSHARIPNSQASYTRSPARAAPALAGRVAHVEDARWPVARMRLRVRHVDRPAVLAVLDVGALRGVRLVVEDQRARRLPGVALVLAGREVGQEVPAAPEEVQLRLEWRPD